MESTSFLITWTTSFGFLIRFDLTGKLWNPHPIEIVIATRDWVVGSYISSLPAPPKYTPENLGFCQLSLLHRLRSSLHPGADVHLQPGEQVSGTLRLSSSCTGRRRIRFLGSALRDCSLSTPRVVHLLPLPEAIAGDFFTGFYIVLRTVPVTSTTRSSSTSFTVRNRL